MWTSSCRFTYAKEAGGHPDSIIVAAMIDVLLRIFHVMRLSPVVVEGSHEMFAKSFYACIRLTARI